MIRSGTPVVAAVAALLALAGCGVAASGAGPGASSPAPRLDAAHAGIPAGVPIGAGAPDTASSHSASPTAPSSSPAAATHPFGRWFHYGDGLWVKVEAPVRFTTSPWVERHPGIPMSCTIEVRNDTGAVWNPYQLHVRLLSGLRPATEIFDYDEGVVARPAQRLPDKHRTRFSVGYWVTDPSRLQLEFAPAFGYDVAVVSRGG